MSELSADRAGRKTLEEDTTTEMASMRSHSRARAKAKEKVKESVLTAAQPDTSQGTAPIRKGTKAKAKESKEHVTTAERKDTLQENAPKARAKEKEKVSREKAKEPGAGERACGR